MVGSFGPRVLLALAAAVLFVWTPAPVHAAEQDVAKGLTVYGAQKCATCHSIGGKGGKASPLDGVGTKLSADELRQWIVNPTEMTAKTKSTKKPPMPNRYSKLPAADVDALVAYMQSLK
jgi:mono/diheme cytochrome c family protein